MRRCTIITPCFDDGHHLVDLRRSLRRGEPVEHIIVDDGSTDARTLEVLDELSKEPHVEVIRSENGGPAAARNLAARTATTPYLLPVDADDVVLPGAVRDMADALDADPELAVVWGDSLAFGSELAYQPRADDLDPWWFTFVNEVVVGLMGRVEPLTRAGWDETSGYEDWGTTLALVGQGCRGANIGRATYGYRQALDAGRLQETLRRDRAEVDNLRARYPGVFAGRRAARRRSSAPRLVRALGSVIGHLPMVPAARQNRWLNRLSMWVWPRRWIHHPVELPCHPLVRRVGRSGEPPTGRFVQRLGDHIDDVGRVVVVSPHLDDAVLSAFSLLDDPDLPADVVNVFTASPPGEDWAARVGASDPMEELNRRRQEDEAAIGDRAERIDLRCETGAAPEELARRVGACLDDAAARTAGRLVVALPAGAGLTESAPWAWGVGPLARFLGSWTARRHPEHVQVADAVLAWGADHPEVVLLRYDEMPYHWARSGLVDADASSVIHLPVDSRAKVDAMRRYDSQLGALFTREQLPRLSRWVPAVESFALCEPGAR